MCSKCCKSCQIVYKHTSATTTLIQHAKKCENKNKDTFKQQKLSFTKNKQITSNDKNKVTEAFVTFCAKDRKPFGVVNGDGMLELCQTFVELGSKYGNFNVSSSNIIPTDRTISNRIKKRAQTERKNFREKMKHIVQDTARPVAYTSDLWETQGKKFSYIGIGVHFIDADWNLKFQTLDFREFNSVLREAAYDGDDDNSG